MVDGTSQMFKKLARIFGETGERPIYPRLPAMLAEGQG